MKVGTFGDEGLLAPKIYFFISFAIIYSGRRRRTAYIAVRLTTFDCFLSIQLYGSMTIDRRTISFSLGLCLFPFSLVFYIFVLLLLLDNYERKTHEYC